MPSPFPGMDPYLEAPDLWPDVHAELIVEFRAQLQPQVSPSYAARIEQYTFLADPDEMDEVVRIVPDVRVVDAGPGGGGSATSVVAEAATGVEVTDALGLMERSRRLMLLDSRSRELITVIELLSPANKRQSGDGRDAFLDKRHEVTDSSASWLEIDLLRGGEPTVRVPQRRRTTYAAFLDRTPDPDKDHRRQYLFPMPLRERLPILPVPLRSGEADVKLDLQAAVETAYARAQYQIDINYAETPPGPPLGEDDAAWMAGLVGERGAES
ncbi:MAG: DUF4058 family protein [Planctomycetota bacterium]